MLREFWCLHHLKNALKRSAKLNEEKREALLIDLMSAILKEKDVK